MSDQAPLRLYRILQSETPSSDDFASKAQLGISCPVDDPEVQRRWTGLSLFGSEEQARRVSRRLPMLGSYIAALDIPPEAGLRAEPTTGPGNYGPPDDPGSGTVLAGQGASDMPEARMVYEVWELASRSLVGAYPNEEQAIMLIAALLDDGWEADGLVLAIENEDVEPNDLPPPRTGDALLRLLREE